ARLAHPNVVTIFDVGVAGESVFIAMEYVRGRTLSKWRRGGHAFAETLAVLLDAGRGLAAAHGAGPGHRDLKADTVIVGEDGRARVLDFGLARAADLEPSGGAGRVLMLDVTEAGTVIGTPTYMAPEQLVGREVGAAADQFAFALTAFETIYGV